MINGSVTANRDAVISIRVFGDSGQEKVIEGLIDTGFSGQLTLPAQLIEQLELQWESQNRAVLANGDEITCNMDVARVEWDGEVRAIRIYETESSPLVGMELCDGFRLVIEVIKNGIVILSRLNDQSKAIV